MLKMTVTLFFILIGISSTALAGGQKLVLDVAFERNIPRGAGINHRQSMENQVRAEFDRKAVISLENGWMLQILAKDRGEDTDLELTILESDKPGAKIIATPHLLASYGKSSVVQWSKDGESLSISVKPAKQDTL
jgi:plasmid stability protein